MEEYLGRYAILATKNPPGQFIVIDEFNQTEHKFNTIEECGIFIANEVKYCNEIFNK